MSTTQAANNTSDDEWSLTQDTIVEEQQQQHTISIPKTSEYLRSTDDGCQAAILRSLRAAGVKFLRYTVVDAFNTIRCKTVPISHAMTKLPGRTQKNSATKCRRPLDNATYQAEICFAGLPSHADIIVPASNLTGRNVLTLNQTFQAYVSYLMHHKQQW